jgi:hypothetical protein
MFYRKPLIAILIILSILFSCALPAVAQKKVFGKKSTKTKAARTIKNSKVKIGSRRKIQSPPKTAKIISFGVVNHSDLAINIVKPKYPKTAKTFGIWGEVRVQILINENGDVENAEAVSGHPLLRPASVFAARLSKFRPKTLGGIPFKVCGIIVYKYLPETFNWLEVGYALQSRSEFHGSFYNLKNLIKYFPLEFADEEQLLETALNAEENRAQTIQIVIAAIEGKLISKPKLTWLFSLGRILSEAGKNINDVELRHRKLSQSLRVSIQTAPENVNQTLIVELEKLVSLLENNPPDEYNSMKDGESLRILIGLLERMPYFGR